MSEEQDSFQTLAEYTRKRGPIRNSEYLQDTIRERARRANMKLCQECSGPEPVKCQNGCLAYGVCMEYPNHLWKLSHQELTENEGMNE